MKQHHESCRKPKDKANRQGKARQKSHKADIDCRHGFPRPLVPKARFTEDGRIELPRASHWVNNYNPYFLAALRCNHDIKHMWGTDTNQMTVLVYMTNYMTKIQRNLLNTMPLVQVSDCFPVLKFGRCVKSPKKICLFWQAALEKWEKYKPKTQADNGWQARTVLVKVHNQLQRDVELSMQTVVSSLADYPERYVSHIPTMFIFKPFLDFIEADDQLRGHDEVYTSETATASTTSESFAVCGNGNNLSISNLRLDYAMRPDGLDNCSLYDFRMCWEKCKLKGNGSTARAAEDWTADAKDREMDEPVEPNQDDAASPICSPVFHFRKQHTQHTTFGMHFRYDHDSRIVVLKGPWVMSRRANESKFARQILLMFKPFRDVSELRKRTQTWVEALEEFEKTASARVKFYISNMEAIALRRSAWEADIAEKYPDTPVKPERRSSDVDDDSLHMADENENSCEDTDDDDSMNDAYGHCLLFDPSGPDQVSLSATYEAGLLAKVFDFTTAQAIRAPPDRHTDMHDEAESRADTWFRTPTTAESKKLDSWLDDVQRQRADILEGKAPGLRIPSWDPLVIHVLCYDVQAMMVRHWMR